MLVLQYYEKLRESDHKEIGKRFKHPRDCKRNVKKNVDVKTDIDIDRRKRKLDNSIQQTKIDMDIILNIN